jgi:CubicO group peptidase (beta-lactamase class C family)
MGNTSWRLRPYLDRLDDVAVMYNFDETDEEFFVVPHFTFADYPAGGIRSSVSELSRFLAAMINEGVLDGAEVLAQSTFNSMLEVQYPDVNSGQAIAWNYKIGERVLAGHGGDDAGASTDMYFDVDRGIGVILLMNVTRRPNTDDIFNRLFEASEACE